MHKHKCSPLSELCASLLIMWKDYAVKLTASLLSAINSNRRFLIWKLQTKWKTTSLESIYVHVITTPFNPQTPGAHGINGRRRRASRRNIFPIWGLSPTMSGRSPFIRTNNNNNKEKAMRIFRENFSRNATYLPVLLVGQAIGEGNPLPKGSILKDR